MLSTAEARPKRLRDARAAMYTELILEAATSVFARDGFDNTKVQIIAKEAGISLGTLYEVFPGKFEIWRAIHERHLDALFQETLEKMAQAGKTDLLDQLLIGLETYLGYLVGHPDYLRLHLLDGSAWALGTGLRSNVQLEAWERGKRLMSDLVARGIEEGALVEEDPELLAQIMIGIHQVRLAHWLKGGMQTPPHEVVSGIEAHTIRAFFVPSVMKRALARLEKRTEAMPSKSRPGGSRARGGEDAHRATDRRARALPRGRRRS